MINLDFCNNKTIGVIGQGVTGKSVIASLQLSGANVISFDDKQQNNFNENEWKELDFIVTSPGVNLIWPQSHKIIQFAHENFIPIYNDIDLFMKWAKIHNKKIIAVTGTNGKSTTTALITHILEQNKIATCCGGNFGIPVLSFSQDCDIYVIELSSYQLESCKNLGFDVGILLNITPDHITRHLSIYGYIHEKSKIFANCKRCIVCIDDEFTNHIFDALSHNENLTNQCNHLDKSKCFESTINIAISTKNFSNNKTQTHHTTNNEDNNIKDIKQNTQQPHTSEKLSKIFNKIYIENDTLIDCINGSEQNKINITDIKINKQNIACAYAATENFISNKEIFYKEAFSSFKSLKHRQEFVCEIDDIEFINDSKATNSASSKIAFDNYKEFYWILGGIAKENGITDLIHDLYKVKHAFLIGDAVNEFKKVFDEHNTSYTICDNLKDAVNKSYEIALNDIKNNHTYKNETLKRTILFSPACASFDQFDNYEHRGNMFKVYVNEINCNNR